MIKKVRVCNFKCYGPRGADFNLSRVNFIFGDNSAGKSTFLQFLKQIGDVCDLDGKCSRENIDKYLFKGEPGAISAKIRVEQESAEEVWCFGVSKSKEAEYELVDANGNLIGREKLLSVLPSEGGESIVHVVANRLENIEKSYSTGGLEKLESRIDIEKSDKAKDYINDILRRLGVPYSCVVNGDMISTVSIHDNDFAIDLPLKDVGTGIEGLVRLALTLNSWRGGILAIEEPETNVNERQLASLMRVLVEEALSRKNGQLIVECHSELMFLQLRNLLNHKHENLRPEDVSIIVVQKTPIGSEAVDVIMDEYGNLLKKWPGGFFPARTDIIDEYYAKSELG